MVDIDRIEKKLTELEAFFRAINSSTDMDKNSLGAGTLYGLNTVIKMKETLNKYKEKQRNIFLKQLYIGFASITRGIEGFNNPKLDEQFTKSCQGIYEIRQELNGQIKW